MGTVEASEFERLYAGRLCSLLSWEQLAQFWQRLLATADQGWYLYAIGEPPPLSAASGTAVGEFVSRVDALLRREHRETYCGIVYTDDIERPSFVKIYDPNHLGSSCGSRKQALLPGWTMSRVPPVDLRPTQAAPEGRRRWWQDFLSRPSPLIREN